MVELAPELTVDGVNDTRAPEGRPVAERFSDWATPLVTVVPMVLPAAEPATTLAEVGEAVMEKSLGGGAVTVKVKVVEWVFAVPVPVTVIG